MLTGPDAFAESQPEPEPGSASGAITDRGLAALRVAATLAHCVPGLRVRLGRDGITVAEIGGDGGDGAYGPGSGAGPWWLTPCAFRASVVQARRRHDQGVRLALRGVAGDPDIDLGVPPGGRAFPGGIHRVACSGRWLYTFALCGDAAMFAPLVAGVVHEAAARPVGRLGLRPDAALGTALCFVEVDGARPPEDGPPVELLGALLARFTVEHLCAEPLVTR